MPPARRNDHNENADRDDRRNRQKCDINRNEADEYRTLHGEAEHVASLGEDRGIASDCSKYARAADAFDRQQLRVPYLIHKAQTDLVDDGFDLGGGRYRDVVLGIDEQKERNDKQHGRPQARLALEACIDGREDRRSGDASER